MATIIETLYCSKTLCERNEKRKGSSCLRSRPMGKRWTRSLCFTSRQRLRERGDQNELPMAQERLLSRPMRREHVESRASTLDFGLQHPPERVCSFSLIFNRARLPLLLILFARGKAVREYCSPCCLGSWTIIGIPAQRGTVLCVNHDMLETPSSMPRK